MHATQKDLDDVRLYESVRSQIARTYRSAFEIAVSDESAAVKPRGMPVQFAQDRRATTAWS